MGRAQRYVILTLKNQSSNLWAIQVSSDSEIQRDEEGPWRVQVKPWRETTNLSAIEKPFYLLEPVLLRIRRRNCTLAAAELWNARKAVGYEAKW